MQENASHVISLPLFTSTSAVTMTGASTGNKLLTGGTGADSITVVAAGADTIIGGQGNDVISLTATSGVVDVIRFANGTGTAGIAGATSLGSDTITFFTGGTDDLEFSEATFGNLNGAADVAALDQTQVVVLADLTTALNTANAQIDTAGAITVTNGAFAVVGTNAATNTVALYYIASTATVTHTVTQALAAGTAVKIADIGLVGSALVLTDFVGIA